MLLVTGQNNHDWPYTSSVHKDTLEGTGRFVVAVTEDPARTLADPAGLKGFSVIVMDYNNGDGPRWTAEAERNFAAAVGLPRCRLATRARGGLRRRWRVPERRRRRSRPGRRSR